MEQEHSNGCLTAPDLGISPGTALQKQQSQSWGPGFFCPTLAVTWGRVTWESLWQSPETINPNPKAHLFSIFFVRMRRVRATHSHNWSYLACVHITNSIIYFIAVFNEIFKTFENIFSVNFNRLNINRYNPLLSSFFFICHRAIHPCFCSTFKMYQNDRK